MDGTIAMSGHSNSDVPPWINDLSKHPFVTMRVKDVATRIFQRIANGEYPFGTRIPAERDLAEDFGETRATIRQVLEFLAAYDVITRRAGSGTFASYRHTVPPPKAAPIPGVLDTNALAETASPFAMNIASSILEPEMVRLATIYMSARDLTELGKHIAKLESIVTEADLFASLEEEFMMMIAQGTHNSLIVAMYTILHEVRRQPQWAASRRQGLTPAKIKSTHRLLRSLHDAIAQRNVETAVELIRLHVANMQEDMIYES
jgi:DNA-binding FadR family transcriptional regulator